MQGLPLQIFGSLTILSINLFIHKPPFLTIPVIKSSILFSIITNSYSPCHLPNYLIKNLYEVFPARLILKPQTLHPQLFHHREEAEPAAADLQAEVAVAGAGD